MRTWVFIVKLCQLCCMRENFYNKMSGRGETYQQVPARSRGLPGVPDTNWASGRGGRGEGVQALFGVGLRWLG